MEPKNFLISLLTNFHFYNLLDWQNVQGALFQVGAKVIIYRSYFNIINDNIIYPIKQPIYTRKHHILQYTSNYDHFLPYSVYMDRRFHISPPGETTQYVVNT